jgi:Trk K+ transport system NAD-binding subunit
MLQAVLFHRFLWAAISIFSLLCMLWLVGSAYMYLCEHNVNVHFVSLQQSSLSVLVYFFSGLEDRQPVTTSGWVGSVVMLITGLIIAAYLTGHFVSYIQRYTVGVIRMGRSLAQRAILVIGWNERAERVVREIFAGFESGLEVRTITVLSEQTVDTARLWADYESHGVTFVAGNPFDKRVLDRIGAHEASSILILADEKAEDPDGKTALIVLALRSLFREKALENPPYVAAEAINHRKIELIRDAGANDVVCHQDYGLGILAQSAFYHELSDVYYQLLTYGGETNEIYILGVDRADGSRGDISEEIWLKHFQGKSFAEACAYFTTHRDSSNPAILLGIQRGQDVILNPRGQFSLQEGDRLIVTAWNRPRLR